MVSARRSARRRRGQAAVAIAAAWRVTGKNERGAWCSAIDWLEVCPGVEGAVPTRGERRPGRSDLRERQCGDAAGRSGANEAGSGATQGAGSAAVMR